MAGPSSPMPVDGEPPPATVLIVPPGATRRMRLAPVSAMYSAPSSVAARPRGSDRAGARGGAAVAGEAVGAVAGEGVDGPAGGHAADALVAGVGDVDGPVGTVGDGRGLVEVGLDRRAAVAVEAGVAGAGVGLEDGQLGGVDRALLAAAEQEGAGPGVIGVVRVQRPAAEAEAARVERADRARDVVPRREVAARARSPVIGVPERRAQLDGEAARRLVDGAGSGSRGGSWRSARPGRGGRRRPGRPTRR